MWMDGQTPQGTLEAGYKKYLHVLNKALFFLHICGFKNRCMLYMPVRDTCIMIARLINQKYMHIRGEDNLQGLVVQSTVPGCSKRR